MLLKSDRAFVSEEGTDARQRRVRRVGTAKINAQRAAMGGKVFDIKHLKAVSGREAIDRHQRKIREMLVIDRVELVFVDQPLEVGKLERNHPVWSQKMRHSRGEVVEVRDLRQDIVADDEIGLPPLGCESLRELQAEEFNKGRNIFLLRDCGYVGGRFDADYRNAQRQKVLKQVSVVARNLIHPTRRIEMKPGRNHFTVPVRVLDPGRRVRRKVRIFRENVLRFHVLLQLHQEAVAADENMQRKVRLHLIDLVGGQEALTKRRHPEIDDSSCENRMTQAAMSRA